MGRALVALGHIVEVVSLDGPDESFIGGYPLRIHTTGPSLGIYGYNLRFVTWLAAHAQDYDAVVVNGLWRYHAFGTWRALRGKKIPYYVYPHGMLDPWFKIAYPLKHLKKWMYWPWADYRVVRDARATLFTSEEERIQSRQSFRLYRARERIVPLGISAPPANASALREQFLAANPTLRGRKILLFLGRIHEKKGCDLLIRAFAAIAKNDPALHLVIAGPGPAGWTAALKQLAGALGIGDRVTWSGLLRDEMKWGAFYAASAFVLPSHQENFGIAVVEALACGLPVLISNKVNIWREIAAAEAGIVDADTEAGTGNTLAAWHSMSDADKRRMSQNALEVFARQFTASAMAERLVSVIQSTASAPASEMSRRVAFVGPLPPPVHGFSQMCGQMLERLREKGVVDVFDRAPHSRGAVYSIAVQARRLIEYAGSCLRHRKTALYLALSGGRGQLIDLIYVLLSKLFRREIFIHHHSYSYINSSSLLNKCFFRFVKEESHVALTRGMGAALSRQYGLDPRKVRVVSNAAFFDVDTTTPPRTPPMTPEIRIGYLSNITLEKGFVEFFAILRALKQQHVAFKATIAGPVAPAAREQFESLLAASTDTEYIGPVYREAKKAFYEQLDIFVFPTKYPNEAEPLVLYEAMNASIFVVASDRGGIREMIGDAGMVAPEISIVERAAECIRRLSQNRPALLSAQKAALSRVQQLNAKAALDLRAFVNHVMAI